MDLFRAIYTSRPFGFDEAILSGILMDARRANARDGITGALICGGSARRSGWHSIPRCSPGRRGRGRATASGGALVCGGRGLDGFAAPEPEPPPLSGRARDVAEAGRADYERLRAYAL